MERGDKNSKFSIQPSQLNIFKMYSWTCLAIQWLRLHAFTTRGHELGPCSGNLISCMLQGVAKKPPKIRNCIPDVIPPNFPLLLEHVLLQ